MADPKNLLLIAAVIGVVWYAYYSMNQPQTGTGPVVNVTPGPPDPGQLQNISQALGAITNEVTAHPMSTSTAGVSSGK